MGEGVAMRHTLNRRVEDGCTWAGGHAVAIAQKMVLVLGQVVENQRSVQRMARRDRTPSFLSLRTLFTS